MTAKGIEFLAEFEPGLYPMYAIELKSMWNIWELQLRMFRKFIWWRLRMMKMRKEIDFSIEYEKMCTCF